MINFSVAIHGNSEGNFDYSLTFNSPFFADDQKDLAVQEAISLTRLLSEQLRLKRTITPSVQKSG